MAESRLDRSLWTALTTHGDRPAIFFEREGEFVSLSFHEARIRGAKIARFIRSKAKEIPFDGRKIRRVAVMANNSPEWILSAIGVVFSDSTLVALDCHLTPKEAGVLLAHSEATLLISDCKTLQGLFQDPTLFPDSVTHLATLDTLPDNLPKNRELFLWSDLVPEGGTNEDLTGKFPEELSDCKNEAVLIYTSGTTGNPKGVVLSHEALTNVIGEAMDRLPASHEDNFLAILPFQHILPMVGTVFGPLSLGASITIVKSLKGPAIKKAMSATGVTVLVGVPRIFEMFLQGIEHGLAKEPTWKQNVLSFCQSLHRFSLGIGFNFSDLLFKPVKNQFGGRLSKLISGGSRLDPRIFEGWLNLGFHIQQGYGLSETSAASFLMPPGTYLNDSVGQPLPSVQVKILNPNEEGIGEILLKGPTIMKGYLKDPSATAEVIRDGWFHTGDLGRLDSRGFLSITGRSKNVIVLSNGKNVYPEDIEILYTGAPCVKEFCIVGFRSGEEELVGAVVVPQDSFINGAPSFASFKEAWKNHCKGVQRDLPTYKQVNKTFISLTPLPRTPSQKVKLPMVRDLIKKMAENGEGF